jgi:poly(3-hydroxybutyrate) depolymerase
MKSNRRMVRLLIGGTACLFGLAAGCGSSASSRQNPSVPDGGAGTDGASVNGEGLDGSSEGGDVGPEAARLPSVGQDPSSTSIPSVNGTCPAMTTGNVMFSGQTWQLWAGTPTADQHGAVLIYWHGTGSSSSEPTRTLGQAQIDAITAEGGIIASPQATTSQGVNTGNGVWYTGDFDTADQVIACAIDQLHVSTQRIYVSGASAGGLQAAWMAYGRSGYIAAAAPLSGGILGAPAQQDTSNVPAAMATHGAQGTDVVIIDFAQASARYEADVKAKGGFAIDCNTGGGHVSGPPQIGPAIWQFLKDHPFKVSPEPYVGALAPVFPSYCKIQ